MKTLAAVSFLAVVLAGVAGAGAEEWTKVRIATEGVYPPFNYMEGGKLTGFDVDIANALCAKMKVQCEIVTQEWDGMIPGLVANKYDAIVASMAITDERKKKVDFTAKYYNTPSVFMATKDAAIKDVSPKALEGKSIGVQGSTTQAAFLEKEYPGSTVKVYTSVDDASADVAAGRIDLVFTDKVVLAEWLKKSSDASCCEIVGADQMGPAGEGKGIAVRKDSPKLREMFDAAIKEIRADGEYEKINSKYFPFSIY